MTTTHPLKVGDILHDEYHNYYLVQVTTPTMVTIQQVKTDWELKVPSQPLTPVQGLRGKPLRRKVIVSQEYRVYVKHDAFIHLELYTPPSSEADA